MDFEFVLPVSRNDLLNKTGVSHYVVDEVLSLREIAGSISDIRKIKEASRIVQLFDSFYSVLCIQKDVPPEVKEDAWYCIIHIGALLVKSLTPLLEEEMDSGTRKCNLNYVKMTCYLLCQYIEMFEMDETKPGTNQVITKGKGKKKKSTLTLEWQKEREQGVKTLLNLIHLHIHRLWEPPIVEEEFISLVTNCCYKLLENPEVNHVVNKDCRDTICHILAVMVKKYNHGLGASLKIIQLLQHFEHLVTPLSMVAHVCVSEYQHTSIVAELMREIGRMNEAELSQDTSGTRAYSSFLVEMAERDAAAVLPNISMVLCHLDGESYSMRNGVLGAMGEILVKVLSKEDLDDKKKDTREKFIEMLEEHVHDVNAFVRARVLQIWVHIVSEKCLPLPHQEHLLGLAVGRLEDKSSSVRKYAIQLIRTLLQNNPFAAKLSVDELQQSYEKEAEKLKEMMPEEESNQQDNECLEQEIEKQWKVINRRLKPVLEDLEEESENQDSPESLVGEEETVESVQGRIFDHMCKEELREAAKLMSVARSIWPEISKPESEEACEDEEMEDVEPLDMLATMKRLYINKKHASSALSAVEAAQTDSQKEDANLANEISKRQFLVQYLKDSLAFASRVQESIPLIAQMLGSKTNTDVLEAIEFFVTGFEFGLTSTMIGIRRMLPLIWSKEAGIKDAVVEAYKRLYLNAQGGNARTKALAVVKNLSALTVGATLGDITSLEGLMVELVKSGDIDQSVIQMLWEKFTMKIPGTTPQESRAAVQLIAMAAGADAGLVKSNIDVLVKEGLGERADTDLLLARDTCLALLKLGVVKTMKGAVGSEPYRLAETHDMFTSLTRILLTSASDLENGYWIPLMEQAINVIYKLAECPDVVCGDLIKKLAVTYSQVTHKETEEPTMEEASEQQPNEIESVTFASGILARLLSLVGHVALRQLVHLDVSVYGEMKRRRAIREQKAWVQTPASKLNKAKDSGQENMEEEMGLGGVAADDADSEFILKICECEIVTGTSLLSAFGPLLVAICTDQGKYPDKELQTAACLALAKFMMVSSNFCEEHLQLLFTVLEKSSSHIIRANTIITVGDLCFRFPNLIEPWTPHLYARLRDESQQVRKNTMQVLTHLILNDMIKVKGQISEMAMCVVDHDDRISNLAKLFFNELSKKGNAVYNIMPDMISRLSDPDVGVDEESFRTIMTYLFSFIQKDKHCESLVEKLCHRYRTTRVDRQWRDLSYCLSMLSYSDKSIAKLHENFMCFADKLAEDEVYSCFCTIISKARSFAKAEAVTLIDELEHRVESCHKKGLNEDEIVERAGASPIKTKGKTPRRPTKTPAAQKTKTRQTRKRTESSDEDIDAENLSPPVSRPQRGRAAKKKQAVAFVDSDDSDIELFEVDKASKKKKGQAEKENPSPPGDSSDSEALTPKMRSSRKGRNKRRLTSLHSPLSVNNSLV